MYRLGVVSFLNARPLIEGLDRRGDTSAVFDVPSRLAARLADGVVDAALIPVVDLLRSGGRFRVLSDGCIGCDGETMTVRVFSQVPPHRIRSLWVDPDSHTSVALAAVVWRELFQHELSLRPFARPQKDINELESVLLIGDKVVDPRRGSFAYEVDLGGAWRQHTGLPFVFAVWAGRTPPATATVPPGCPSDALAGLAQVLSEARDRGVARAAEIAEQDGPAAGWPIELARRYLTRCLTYTLDERAIAGANLFARHCAALGLVPPDAEITWPAGLLERRFA
ncbi:MAG: menaquinone biosynthesis protein [Planctomycetes bacterium]|nr:menaquinone biosynthesis protein [Planctomycetota bacterium]